MLVKFQDECRSQIRKDVQIRFRTMEALLSDCENRSFLSRRQFAAIQLVRQRELILTSPHRFSPISAHMHHNNKSGHYSASVTINSTDHQNPSSIDSPKWGRQDQHNSALVVKTASTRKYAARSSARHVRLPAFDRPLHVNNLLLAQL
jgi:hypothetical protein